VMPLDAVMTTGATSQAAAEALQAAGYGVVGVLCLAHRQSP
jgi:predicted amidophosphoribosyltransferase